MQDAYTVTEMHGATVSIIHGVAQSSMSVQILVRELINTLHFALASYVANMHIIIHDKISHLAI